MNAVTLLLIFVLLACCLPMLWMMMRGKMSKNDGHGIRNRDRNEK